MKNADLDNSCSSFGGIFAISFTVKKGYQNRGSHSIFFFPVNMGGEYCNSTEGTKHVMLLIDCCPIFLYTL